MTSLLRLVWFSLLGITVSTGTAQFVEFLAPQENEVVIADSMYPVKWATKSSTGRGTMILLAGQTPDSLTRLWEIAYSLDVGAGGFSWPVGFPTLGAQLSSFYCLNFSLEGSEGTSSVSPLFTIVSRDNTSSEDHKNNDHSDNSDDKGVGEGGVATGSVVTSLPPVTSTLPSSSLDNPTPAGPTSDRLSSVVISTPTKTKTILYTTDEIPTPLDSVGNNTDDNKKATQAPSLNPSPKVGNGAIAGIAIGSTVALIAFASLIGMVLYYRRRSLESSSSDETKHSKIGGRFQKAELDAEEAHITVTRVFELDATLEIQEADGNMKPIEIDSTIPRSESAPTGAKSHSMYVGGCEEA